MKEKKNTRKESSVFKKKSELNKCDAVMLLKIFLQ
jgi:hypothetical protein